MTCCFYYYVRMYIVDGKLQVYNIICKITCFKLKLRLPNVIILCYIKYKKTSPEAADKLQMGYKSILRTDE